MKKLANKFKDISINKKLYWTIFLCLILPLILVFCIMNGVIGRKFRENQFEKELETLKQSKPVLENFISDIQMVSRNILTNEDTQTLLEYYDMTGEYEENAGVSLNFYLGDLMSSREYISSVSIYQGERILLQRGNYYEKESIDEIPGMREKVSMAGGKAVWEPARILPYYLYGNENEYVVSLQRNINNLYKMENMGTERISVKELYLCSLYKTEESPEEARMYIFDADGDIISASDKEMLETKAGEEIRANTDQSEGYFRDESGKKAFMYYKISENDWTVVKEMELGDIDAQIGLINFVIWICLGLALFFGFSFSFLQKRTIVDPIIKLSKDVGQIDGDGFKIGLYTESRDEVGELNRNVIKMSEKLTDLINTVYKSKIKLQEAEILSLQSQINPHFLYNTLDTLRWIALEHGEKKIAEQIEALSNLFRHVLNNGNEITTVKAELEHLRNYLLIQETRFGDKIRTTINAQEKLYPCKVVKLILQPLVENAFVHGLEKKVGGGEIKVTVDEKNGMIRYIVEDNGLGADEKTINDILNMAEDKDSQNVFALKNINNRIKLKYGESYGMTFESTQGKGTKVTVLIPYMQKEERHEDTDRR